MLMKKRLASFSFGLVIPYYNHPQLLNGCLESVLRQSRALDCIIVVDDGSIDDPLAVISYYKELLPLKYSRLPNNVGPSAARNYGVSQLDTEYILFLDSDDHWKPNHVEIIAAEIESTDVEFVATAYDYKQGERVCRSVALGDNGVVDTDIFELLSSLRLPFITSSSCFSRKLFLRLGGFHEGLRLGEDQLLWIRLWLCSDVYLINKSTVDYSVNTPGSVTKVSNSSEILKYLIAIKSVISDEVGIPESIRLNYTRYMSRQYLRACLAASQEHGGQFTELFSRRKKYSPEMNVSYKCVLYCLYLLGPTGRKKISKLLLSLASWLRFVN